MMSLSAVMICSAPHLVPFTFLSVFYLLLFFPALFSASFLFHQFSGGIKVNSFFVLSSLERLFIGFHPLTVANTKVIPGNNWE